MADDITSLHEWQCPPQHANEDRRLGWINSATEEGMAWLRSQRGYGDFKRSLDVISGRLQDVVPEYRSHLNTNQLKTNIRTVIGSLAKLRPMWGYHSDNTAFRDQAEMMNKITRAWYLESFADRSIKEALQYAAATCSGYVRPVYRRAMYGTGQGDITLLTYGSPCVLPVQLPANNDLQQAYAVSIMDEMPIAMTHGMFPLFQDKLQPTSSQYWYSAEIRQAGQKNMFKRIWGAVRGDKTSGLSELYCPVRYTYVIDLSINKSGITMPMGEPGTSWFYEVPSYGSDIRIGTDRTGQPLFRKANENDARLYPYRRLLISSENCIMYDGPAFDWHGKVPLLKFSVDDWPWEPIGFSMARDGYDTQLAINQLERGVMDKHQAQLDPALAYDTNAVSSREAKAFDPMQPRARLGFDGSMVQQPFQSPHDPNLLKVDPQTMLFLTHLSDVMNKQLCVHQAESLANARTMGADGNDIDKVLELSGPIIEDISRSMEPPMRDLGSMVKYLILQYYTAPRVMQIVGADGITPETFDYDPSSLVPSHAPGEQAQDSNGTPVASVYTQVQRARVFADNLRFFILPNSLHELTQMSMKLGYIQLRKAGVQIDSQTIAEAWSVPNFGNIPGNTVLDRWKAEQDMVLQQQARLKQLIESIPGAVPPPPPGTTPPPAGPAGGGQQEGRPPSGHAAPELKSKSGGLRSTITESR